MSLYITDANDAESALSLTLAPRRVLPRKVRRSLVSGAMPVAVRRAGSSTRGELDQPYVEAIARVFSDLAQNNVPSGYGLRKASRGEHVTCGQYGIKVTRGQVLEGHRPWLITARVKNTGKRRLKLEKRTCSTGLGDGVAAIAAWPRALLAPGESAELYLAVRPRGSPSVTP